MTCPRCQYDHDKSIDCSEATWGRDIEQASANEEALAQEILAWHDARTAALLKSQIHSSTGTKLCSHLTAEYEAEVEFRRKAVDLARAILHERSFWRRVSAEASR